MKGEDNLKFKVIENDMPNFEEELNEFVSQPFIKVIDIKYSTSGLAPDEEYGWHTTNMHNALIRYVEVEIDDILIHKERGD